MATILLTWELGGGLGHLINLLPLAEGLCRRGHRVFAAVKDLSRVDEVFAGIDASFLQAPVKVRKSGNRIEPLHTFAHILHNCGFGGQGELLSMTQAWRNLYDYVRPDAIVFDHSPTALLAARGINAKKTLVGTGFFCPLDEYPLPDLRPWMPAGAERLKGEEDRVLKNANRTIESWHGPTLERLSQLYRDVDENFLLTFEELDHYPGRAGAGYRGAWPNIDGKPPEWPEGEGQRIYAYLKPFPALSKLLQLLAQSRHPTIICCDGIDASLQEQHASATLHFENRPMDLALLSRQCDLAILNGNHGTTVSMLLAGKPTLQIPITLEQLMLSGTVARMGAGLRTPSTREDLLADSLSAMLTDSQYAEAAGRFAQRYADYDPHRQVEIILDRIEELTH